MSTRLCLKINVNDSVHVRLTDRGRDIIRATTRPMPRENQAGMSTWVLWDLMACFGEHLYPTMQPPFEPVIEVEV